LLGLGGLLGGLPPLAGLERAPGLGAAVFFWGRRFPAASAASPSDCFFAIAACLPCLAKLRQGDHTAVDADEKLPPIGPAV
jgi:hypothetical protein